MQPRGFWYIIFLSFNNKHTYTGGKTMFCPKCGNMIQENASFCGFCGTPLTPNVPDTPSSSVSQVNLYDEDTPTQAFPDTETYSNSGSYQNSAGQVQDYTAYNSNRSVQGQGYPQHYNNAQFSQAQNQTLYYNNAQPGQAQNQTSYYNNAQPGQTQNNSHYQIGGFMKEGYSFNSDSLLFSNPHTKLLVSIVILGFLTAIFCNCGLIRFHSELLWADPDLEAFRFFPMCLIAAGCIYALSTGRFDDRLFTLSYSESKGIYTTITVFFVVMAILALCIFISACIIGGKSSLKYRTARSQLRSMNSFLILNWVFWLLYTLLILLPAVLVYSKVGHFYFMLQYTVCGYLYTGCLIFMTVLKCIYSKKITVAYDGYEKSKAFRGM